MAHTLPKNNSSIILALHRALLEPDKNVGHSSDLRIPFGIHLAHDKRLVGTDQNHLEFRGFARLLSFFPRLELKIVLVLDTLSQLQRHESDDGVKD